MHNPILREEMEDFYHCLQKILRHDEVDIPSTNYDLTLDIMPSEDGRIQWSYYYACHETRCLFWLDTYDANQMISELFGVRSPALISLLQISSSSRALFPLTRYTEHRIEALYWCVLLYSVVQAYVRIDIHSPSGHTGLSFQLSSKDAISYLPSTMNSWECCRMVAWVNLFLLACFRHKAHAWIISQMC
jgi:hypothetical protein